MFCQQCGYQLKEGAAFCTNCGARQNPGQVSPIQTPEDDMEKTVGVFNTVPQKTPLQTPPQTPFNQELEDDAEKTVGAFNTMPPHISPVQKTGLQSHVQSVPPVHLTSDPQPNTYHPVSTSVSNGSVSFGEAIALFFKNYTNFSGRATKSEYWWAFLFNSIVSLVAALLSNVIPPLGGLISLAVLIPGISLAVRRLHDVGKPGSWWFMGLIPFAGGIILLILFLQDSDGDNQYGPGPASAAVQHTSIPVKNTAVQRPLTERDIYAMARNHEPVNLNTPDAKHMLDSALSQIIPTYTGIENLAGAIMLCNPHSINGSITTVDTDTLLVILKALGFYMDQGADSNVLGVVQQNVLDTLKTRF